MLYFFHASWSVVSHGLIKEQQSRPGRLTLAVETQTAIRATPRTPITYEERS